MYFFNIIGFYINNMKNPFFFRKKKACPCYSCRNQRSSLQTSLYRVTTKLQSRGVLPGGTAYQTLKDPISKLSHHERSVNSSTSIGCQKALINILKVSTHTKHTNSREEIPF